MTAECGWPAQLLGVRLFPDGSCPLNHLAEQPIVGAVIEKFPSERDVVKTDAMMECSVVV